MGIALAAASRQRAYDRLAMALAGSALLHGLGVSMGLPEWSPGSARGREGPISVTLRAERPPVAPAVAPGLAEPATRAGPKLRRHAGAEPPIPTPILPTPEDLAVYTAGELDSLPVPVAPLEIASAMPVRLELTIDEHGAVRSISIAGPAGDPLKEKVLREVLAATAFVPARKDGRAVKSRIVLGVE